MGVYPFADPIPLLIASRQPDLIDVYHPIQEGTRTTATSGIEKVLRLYHS